MLAVVVLMVIRPVPCSRYETVHRGDGGIVQQHLLLLQLLLLVLLLLLLLLLPRDGTAADGIGGVHGPATSEPQALKLRSSPFRKPRSQKDPKLKA